MDVFKFFSYVPMQNRRAPVSLLAKPLDRPLENPYQTRPPKNPYQTRPPLSSTSICLGENEKERGHPVSAADSPGARYGRRSRSPRLYLFTRPLLTSCRLGKTSSFRLLHSIFFASVISSLLTFYSLSSFQFFNARISRRYVSKTGHDAQS